LGIAQPQFGEPFYFQHVTNPASPQSSDASEPFVLGKNPTLADLLDFRISRRDTFKIGLVATAVVAAPSIFKTASADAATKLTPQIPGLPGIAKKPAESAGFTGIAPLAITDDAFRVPAGYETQVILRWGDPLVPGAPAFDINKQTADAQSKQVGFNHDYQHFFADDETGTKGVLVINHEYTTAAQMIPGYNVNTTDLAQLKTWVDIELAAHGASIAELSQASSGKWEVLPGKRNRRITGTTPMVMSGPAAQDERLRGDVLGMFNNCSGGYTPWGTLLTCEENFNQYFANSARVADVVTRTSHTRYGVTAGATGRAWEKIYDRFDAAKNPNEPFKYGWVVEIDPDDPTSAPIKRTALGRFKHEAATTVIASTGQVVVYSGDDERFDYFYKYVSYGKYDPAKGKANGALLDEGTLFVARMWPDGTGEWIPLVNRQRTELSGAAGFVNQADVLIRARQAGDAVGATKMDRPEDIEANPATGKVYVTMTNNANRRTNAVDDGERAANPRFDARDGNRTGHIIELSAANGNHANLQFTWEVFLLAGDPARYKLASTVKEAAATTGTYYAGYTGVVSAIGSPDNVAFSPDGLLWIATDGAPGSIGYNDALHCVPVAGPNRGQAKQFLSVPAGAECCGPCFTPDQKSLFVAVQHPGEDGTLSRAGDPTANTQSSWPDGPNTVPRPSTVVIRHSGGKTIGF
jgi:uncharacterized protein